MDYVYAVPDTDEAKECYSFLNVDKLENDQLESHYQDLQDLQDRKTEPKRTKTEKEPSDESSDSSSEMTSDTDDEGEDRASRQSIRLESSLWNDRFQALLSMEAERNQTLKLKKLAFLAHDTSPRFDSHPDSVYQCHPQKLYTTSPSHPPN